VDDDSDGFGVHDTVDPAFCSDSTTTGTADGSPGDYKRVTVNATWTVRGKTRTVRQVTLLPPGGTGDAPTVASLQPRSGTAGQPLVITSQTPTTYTFDATTTNKPSYMSWLIDGTPNQTCPPITSTCGGSLNSWFFTWDIGAPTIDNTSGSPNLGKCISPVGSSSYVYDGTYQVWAQPLDSNGLAGSASSTPVTINRCVPIPPPNFNVTGQEPAYNGPVDVEWNDNPEGDVVGYKVFRGTSLSNFTPICPASATAAPIAEMNTCIDPTPPAHQPGVPIYYAAIAYDQDQTGAIRAGALAYLDSESPTNKAPKAPTNLTATASGGTVTVTWTIPATPLDPDTGDTIASYRVYRRLPPTPTTTPWTYQDRLSYQRPPDDGYDSVTAFCNGSTTSGTVCSYTDTNPGGVVHQYTVKSVDTHLRESNVPGGAVPTA
jgi:hypothetical protein